MWDVRGQIHRLQNKDHIEARLHRQAEVHGILDRYAATLGRDPRKAEGA